MVRPGRPPETFIDQLVTNSGHNIEELPTAMMIQQGWNGVKRIRANSTQQKAIRLFRDFIA